VSVRRAFLKRLIGHGLAGAWLIIADACLTGRSSGRRAAQIRQRTSVVGLFLDGRSALNLAAGRVRRLRLPKVIAEEGTVEGPVHERAIIAARQSG
jgi:hypothetical protein